MNDQTSRSQIRVLRIAHASLTPALRERERALVRLFPDISLEVVTTTRWHEAGVDVDAVEDDLFPVIKARPLLSKHIAQHRDQQRHRTQLASAGPADDLVRVG